MTTRFGVFGETPGIGVGDPYQDAAGRDARAGAGLKVRGARSGKNNDATFDRFKPLFEGERYIDPCRRRLQAAQAAAAAAAAAAAGGGGAGGGGGGGGSGKPFKPASPMKAAACPGDFHGTLGGRVAYVAVSKRGPWRSKARGGRGGGGLRRCARAGAREKGRSERASRWARPVLTVAGVRATPAAAATTPQNHHRHHRAPSTSSAARARCRASRATLSRRRPRRAPLAASALHLGARAAGPRALAPVPNAFFLRTPAGAQAQRRRRRRQQCTDRTRNALAVNIYNTLCCAITTCCAAL